ncbi:unnamed protein product, partial [Discosporangium mesarthrocarpum]
GKRVGGGGKRGKPVSRESYRTPALPTRRSSRNRSQDVHYSEDKPRILPDGEGLAPLPSSSGTSGGEELKEEDFDDSSVLKYLCQTGLGPVGMGAGAGTWDIGGDRRVVGLRLRDSPD